MFIYSLNTSKKSICSIILHTQVNQRSIWINLWMHKVYTRHLCAEEAHESIKNNTYKIYTHKALCNSNKEASQLNHVVKIVFACLYIIA